VTTKPPTTPATSRQKPSALSVLEGGAEVAELAPEPTKKELLLERYEGRTFRGGASLGALPRPTWLIRGLLLADSLAAIYGQKGQGKTHYSMAMSLELARGGEWHGQRLRPRPVLYLVGEGSSSFVERLEAWQEFHKTEAPATFYSAHLEPAPQLVEGVEMEAFAELVRRKFTETGLPTGGLIVLDTFQTATVGLDEISGKEMGVAIDALQGLRRASGSTVAIVHHAGKALDRGQRGHSSLGASMETEVEVSKEASSPNVKARLVKMRAAPDGGERSYRLNLVTLEPTDEDRLEALELGLPAVMRSVPVATETESSTTPLKSRNEELLVAMLTSYSLADGLKRTDVEKLLGVKRSTSGDVLGELKRLGYVTNESPFTGRHVSSSYWLTDDGRRVAESVQTREARTAVEDALREESF
jgi:hypothetical protein